MAQVNQELLQRFQRASRRPEGDGHDVKLEVREDEDQSLKLQEIVELLVAAGYFRARIKGLSPFDKVVGGLTWCMEALSVDLDVDLLFQENATIGQQIALSEKIVAVLPRIQCPHRIEPHQVQGLDFIHVFPVVQWLVKASMEARQQKSAAVRVYALQQYAKAFPGPEGPEGGLSHLEAVQHFYRPQRRFKRKGPPPPDVQSRVQITLMEYEHRSGGHTQGAPDEPVEEAVQEQLPSLSAEEEARLQQHYQALHRELREGGATASNSLHLLEEQLRAAEAAVAQVGQQRGALEVELHSEQRLLEATRLKQQEVDSALQALTEKEQLDPKAVEAVEALVLKNEALKGQESYFKASCKKEMARLQTEIEGFRQEAESPADPSPDLEQLSERLQNARRQLAKRNQAVVRLQRLLDDVPSRAELAQYQRRFLELYNQVAAKHKETKQYYSLYNTLEDQRRYMRKELALLNSVAENYPRAFESAGGKEEMLLQLQGAVEGVRQNRLKLQLQVADERQKRDQLAEEMQHLLELQRTYATAVKELSVQGRQFEALLGRS